MGCGGEGELFLRFFVVIVVAIVFEDKKNLNVEMFRPVVLFVCVSTGRNRTVKLRLFFAIQIFRESDRCLCSRLVV